MAANRGLDENCLGAKEEEIEDRRHLEVWAERVALGIMVAMVGVVEDGERNAILLGGRALYLTLYLPACTFTENLP